MVALVDLEHPLTIGGETYTLAGGGGGSGGPGGALGGSGGGGQYWIWTVLGQTIILAYQVQLALAVVVVLRMFHSDEQFRRI